MPDRLWKGLVLLAMQRAAWCNGENYLRESLDNP